jgi:hypothetical protein
MLFILFIDYKTNTHLIVKGIKCSPTRLASSMNLSCLIKFHRTVLLFHYFTASVVAVLLLVLSNGVESNSFVWNRERATSGHL